MANYREKMKKRAKIGQKWPKLGQKRQKWRIFVDFWTYFQNLITFRKNFSQTSLTPEMKDLMSCFHIKVKPKAHLQPFFSIQRRKTTKFEKIAKIAKNSILAKNGEKFEFTPKN